MWLKPAEKRPYYDIVRKDRIEQALAELSLRDVEHQFPVQVARVTPPEGGSSPLSAIAIRRAMEVLEYDTDKVTGTMRQSIESFFGRPIPVEEIAPSYLDPKTQEDPNLLYQRLEPFNKGELFDISTPLGEGAQGATYDIDIHPNSTLHVVSLLDREKGQTTDIAAVLKKSAIYNYQDWLRYNLLKTILDQYDTIDPKSNEYAVLEELVSKLIDHSGPERYFTGGKEFLRQRIREYEKTFIGEYNDMRNEAYVDAFGYYLGSLLMQYLISPFFPLFYASFRAFDENFFTGELVDILGPKLNQNFPVEVVIMQPLHKTVTQMDQSDEFFIENDPDYGYFDRKIMSMFAQIIFGLTAAQKVYGIVNNDLNTNNVMYEQVAEDTNLYYHVPNTDLYWQIPTFGNVFKMIDFGRASFRFDDVNFASQRQAKELRGGIHLDDPNSDLYRFASTFVSTMGWRELLAESPPEAEELENVIRMLQSILDCNGGETVFTEMEECAQPSQSLKEQIQSIFGQFDPSKCGQYIFQKWPYRVESKCKHAVPSKNLHWFDEFRIQKKDLPGDAIVFSVFV
jgi:hypothetical protein